MDEIGSPTDTPGAGSCCHARKKIGILPFSLYHEARPGAGEDATPLLKLRDGCGALGAFDGLGGAGSAMYTVGDSQRSGAYIASRFAEARVERFLDEHWYRLSQQGIGPEGCAQLETALRD